MRVAFFGNNLNQGYDFVTGLVRRGIAATLIEDRRGFEQDTHGWWSNQIRNESLVENVEIEQNDLASPGPLVNRSVIRKLYDKLKSYDCLVLREYGPALFSELQGPVKIFWSAGSDLQILPFAADIFAKPRESLWTRIGSRLRLRSVPPPEPFWANTLQDRQRLGLSQCARWILLGYQWPVAQKLNMPANRLHYLQLPMRQQLREDFDVAAQRQLQERYKGYDHVFLHPTRQFYLRLNNNAFLKDNDKLFHAYRAFLQTTNARCVLLAIEKGRPADLAASKQLVRELALQDHVEWISELPNRILRAYYTLDQLVVCDQFSPMLPAMGNTGREATMFGRPLITSYDLSNRLTHGEDFPPNVFPASSPAEIAEAMKKVAGMAAQQRRELADAARGWFLRHLDAEPLMDRYAELLHSLMAARPAA